MAERGVSGPFFYKGYFQHRSIRSEDMTLESRLEYRAMYRKLLKAQPKRNGKIPYKNIMKARATLRVMLYAEY